VHSIASGCNSSYHNSKWWGSMGLIIYHNTQYNIYIHYHGLLWYNYLGPKSLPIRYLY